MSEQQLDRSVSSEQDRLLDGEMEIDLMDILRKIISIRKTLYEAAEIGLVMGITVVFSIPKQYAVKVTLSPEMGNSKSTNGIAEPAASFLGSGATIGDGTDTLNASPSSDVVSSTPFLLELMDVNVPIDKDDMLALGTYPDSRSSPWWNYIIGIPGSVINGVKSLSADENDNSSEASHGTIELTEKENKKIDALKEKVIANVNKKTTITNVLITLQEPRIAAVVVDSVVRKL